MKTRPRPKAMRFSDIPEFVRFINRRGIHRKMFTGKRAQYFVFRDEKKVHVLREVGATKAARRCGAKGKGKPRAITLWKQIWDK